MHPRLGVRREWVESTTETFHKATRRVQVSFCVVLCIHVSNRLNISVDRRDGIPVDTSDFVSRIYLLASIYVQSRSRFILSIALNLSLSFDE